MKIAQKLAILCLQQYPSTIEMDRALINSVGWTLLNENERNCVIHIIGEKEVLMNLLFFSKNMEGSIVYSLYLSSCSPPVIQQA